MQVRHEDKYRGLIPTFLAVWKVSTRLSGLVSFLIWLVFKERGIRGFFDGASLRLSRKIFSSAIGWAVYESLLVFARTRNREKYLLA
jgi:solute carrier family 25 protein 38